MHDILQKRIPPAALWGLAILVLVFVGQRLQSHVHLNHDVSWFVHFSRWLLQGRTLGTDLHDGNLPMVWGVFMPPAALANWNLLSESAAVRTIFSVYLLVSTALLIGVVSRLTGTERRAAVGWVIAFVLVAALTPGFSFGQREHVSVLFAMPYLAAAVLRLQGGQIRRSIAIFVGLLAGIGFAIKPHFLAVPALVELLLLVRLGWRSLLHRAESLTLALAVLVYVAGAALVIGDYLKSTIGMTLSAYWAYDTANSAAILQRFIHVAQPVVYGVLIALVTRTWSRQHTVLLLATLGYSLSYFVQSKGFVYHAYPVFVCSAAFFGICVARGLLGAWVDWQTDKRWPSLVVLVLAVVLVLPPVKRAHDDVVRWYFTYSVTRGPVGQFRQAVIDLVDHFAPTRQSYFFAFTTHPFPGFPTASYTKAEYSGRTIVQQFIPAYARLDEVTDPAIRKGVIRAAEYQRRTVIEDFERRPPTVVLVEGTGPRLGMNGRQFDDISFYIEDLRFQKIWANYREYPPLGPLRVFVLRSTDPAHAVASEGDESVATATH